MNSCLVDVIVPVFNPGLEFRETIASITNQSYKRLRILVVDDGSSQAFCDFIKKVCDSDERIELTRTPRNNGGGAARNLALTISTAPYVAFCDADDRWPIDKIEKQISLLRSGVDCTHTDMRELTLLPDRSEYRWRASEECIGLSEFLETTGMFCSSVMLRREVIENARFGTMKARHPFKFWCHIFSRGYKSIRTPECYFDYVKKERSVSSNKFRMLFYTLAAYLLYVPNKRLAVQKAAARFARYVRGYQ